MAEFSYTVIDKTGKKINGTITASDSETAVENLREKGMYILEIQEGTALNKEVKFSLGKKVKLRDLALFCRQFSTMIQSGVNILSCLDVIREQTTNKKFADIIGEMYEEVRKGTPVSISMRNHKNIFPNILINMMEAGEISGSIDKSLEKMAVYFEKEQRMRQKIVNALMYPLIVMIVAIIVLNLLLIFVIPTFAGIFSEMGIELPASTKFILASSVFMKKNWYIVLAVLILLVLFYKQYKRSTAGGISLGRLRLKIPLIGKISLNNSTSRFSRTLSTLMGAGISLLPALETVNKVFQNPYIETKFEEVNVRVKGGENLSEAIRELKIFPQLVIVMMMTGEESGSLETMLERIADYYENEVDNSVTRLTAVFEPIIIVFMALIVGFMMASIILPMFKLYGSIG